VNWIIFYSDGTRVSNEEMNVGEVKSCEVQAILWWSEDKSWLIIQGYEYYIWKYNRWYGAELGGKEHYLMQPGWKKVLYGDWIPDDRFEAIIQEAKRERKWLLKERPYGDGSNQSG
jgi:hypothetical protein